MKWVVFDCEGDGLKPTKFYCLSYYDGTKSGTLTDYDDIREFFLHYDVYIGHNIRRFDLVQLSRVVGIRSPNRVIDTLGVSWYLEPKRKRHGLEEYGIQFGVPKPKITDWNNLSLEEYIHRCEEDVKINTKLWQQQLQMLRELYPDPEDMYRFLNYLDFKLKCAALAEESRWKFDEAYCRQSIERLGKIRDDKYSELEQAMPEVPIVETRKPPARPYKADGQLSVSGQVWQNRLERAGLPPDHDGPFEEIIGFDKGNPRSHDQLKEWLFSLGWVPDTYKDVKSKSTGNSRSVPQVNKESQKGGGLTDSVKLLFDKEPALEALDDFFVLNHRISLLEGFIRDQEEGYLSAKVAGLANTLRFKHAEIVNLPRVTSKYGTEVRGCLIAEDDEELCGADMSSLEDRLKQHFLYKHDPDYVKELMRDDYDPHLDLAVLGGAISSDDAAFYIRVDRASDEEKKALTLEDKNRYKLIKTVRSIYKNGNYACQYGAGVPRLMVTCGCDEETASHIHKTYWKRNWAIKAVSAEQRIRVIKNGAESSNWLFNPISGFWYSLRSKKDIFSTLVQGSAVYCFDTWVSVVVSDRPQLTGQFHDEIILGVKRGHQTPIREWLEGTIEEVNDFLQLNRRLDIGIQFGHRYADIH